MSLALAPADPCRCGKLSPPQRLGCDAQLHLLFIHADLLCAYSVAGARVRPSVRVCVRRGKKNTARAFAAKCVSDKWVLLGMMCVANQVRVWTDVSRWCSGVS